MECLACLLSGESQCYDCEKQLCDDHSLSIEIPYGEYVSDDGHASFTGVCCQNCVNERDGWY